MRQAQHALSGLAQEAPSPRALESPWADETRPQASTDAHLLRPTTENTMAAAKSSRSKKSAKPQKRFFFLPVQNFTEELGYRISVARRVQGLTQSQLAKKSQTSLTTYKRIEKGDMTASIGTILSILYSLGELESCEGILSSIEGIKPEELPQRIRKPNP